MSRANPKQYYISFYPGDWLKDLALNACSLQTQGAWVRLLCHMHESEVCGYLIVNGRALDKKGIKKLLKVDDENFEIIWTELTENGVLKKDEESGAFFSKRMVNDYKKYTDANVSNENTYKKNSDITKSIINYLNKKVNQEYNIADAGYMKLVNEKLTNGYVLQDFKTVIDAKCKEWLGDKKMEQFLRPATLFGPKFGEYLSQAKKEVKEEAASRVPKMNKNPYNDMKK